MIENKEPIETDISKEDFLEKIKNQHGWIDAVDAFRLINFYVYEFGNITTNMSIEFELSFMYQKLLGNQIKRNKFYSKQCKTCNLIKPRSEYGNQYKNINCNSCVIEIKKLKEKIAK